MRVLTIGRKGTDIVLPDNHNEISRLHAELTITDQGGCYLVDCGSSNGTSVQRQNGWQHLKQDYVTKDESIRFRAPPMRP
jgi:pSer/pThr/pTyr-binding forkhead associated (FHA) protein